MRTYIIIVSIFLIGCTTEQKPNVEFTIPEAQTKIAIPNGYTITKNNEENRRGSFISFDFYQEDSLPLFQEIQFFSDSSIKKFNENCKKDSPCFFGDYPDLTRYNGQKEAFKNKENYLNYELKKFNNRYYFISNINCTGDSCVIREYTTFLDAMQIHSKQMPDGNQIGEFITVTAANKVDIWIIMEDDSQANQADHLFEKFEIIE